MRLLVLAAPLVSPLLFPMVASAAQITLTYDTGVLVETIPEPDPDFHGPYAWLESGVRISGMWAVDVGTPDGFMGIGHVHSRLDSGNPTGVAGFMHSWTDDLQGIEISLESGSPFDLVSFDYGVRALEHPDPLQQRLPWSFAATDPQILLAESFDPTVADFESEWTILPAIDDGLAFRSSDWHTMTIVPGTGFENLTSLLISQTSNYMYIDNIVLSVDGPDPTGVPEPGTATLLGLGLGLVMVSRRPRG